MDESFFGLRSLRRTDSVWRTKEKGGESMIKSKVYKLHGHMELLHRHPDIHNSLVDQVTKSRSISVNLLIHCC